MPTEGLIAYSIPKGVQRGIEIDLSDQSYDGQDEGDRLVGGLGQLTDGIRGNDNFRSDVNGFGKGNIYDSWNYTNMHMALVSQPHIGRLCVLWHKKLAIIRNYSFARI